MSKIASCGPISDSCGFVSTVTLSGELICSEISSEHGFKCMLEASIFKYCNEDINIVFSNRLKCSNFELGVPSNEPFRE